MTTSLIAARGFASLKPRRIRMSRTIAGPAVVAVGGIMLQQLIHTPWGLPGHRGLFWLAPLIAARWAIDRPNTALGIAAASSTGILLVDASMGVHVAAGQAAAPSPPRP